jgi:hypothetical protein
MTAMTRIEKKRKHVNYTNRHVLSNARIDTYPIYLHPATTRNNLELAAFRPNNEKKCREEIPELKAQ